MYVCMYIIYILRSFYSNDFSISHFQVFGVNYFSLYNPPLPSATKFNPSHSIFYTNSADYNKIHSLVQ